MRGVLLILLMCACTPVLAESFSDRLYNRQIVKQRERFKLSDLPSGKVRHPGWLATNKDTSWLENYVSLASGHTIQKDKNAQDFSGGLFLTILGVEA